MKWYLVPKIDLGKNPVLSKVFSKYGYYSQEILPGAKYLFEKKNKRAANPNMNKAFKNIFLRLKIVLATK